MTAKTFLTINTTHGKDQEPALSFTSHTRKDRPRPLVHQLGFVGTRLIRESHFFLIFLKVRLLHLIITFNVIFSSLISKQEWLIKKILLLITILFNDARKQIRCDASLTLRYLLLFKRKVMFVGFCYTCYSKWSSFFNFHERLFLPCFVPFICHDMSQYSNR